MTRLLRALLAKTDCWPPTRLLWIDIALAVFVGIAHGGALLVARSDRSTSLAETESLALVSLPFAALVLTSGVLALLLPRLRPTVLGLHGAVFLLAAIEQLVWAVHLLVHGVPQGDFAWSVGLFTITVAYAVYIFSRYTVPAAWRVNLMIYYSPAFALVLAAFLDLSVFLRFANELSTRFGG